MIRNFVGENTRAYDVAQYLGHVGDDATPEERQLYFDLVNIERARKFEREGSYGDNWGPGIATINGFIKFPHQHEEDK